LADFDPLAAHPRLAVTSSIYKVASDGVGIMTANAREYLDFWIENSVHAAEQFRTLGASQDVTELVRRLIEGAKGQGISEKDIQDEVGDLTEYVRGKLRAANKAENDRTDSRRK
jgi:hypothetical protein